MRNVLKIKALCALSLCGYEFFRLINGLKTKGIDTMTTVLYFIIAFIIGLIIGVFYFQLLWLTVSNLPKSKRPYMLSIVSLFVRLIIVFLAFFLIITIGNWQHLIVCLLGFVGVRILYINRIKRDNIKEE